MIDNVRSFVFKVLDGKQDKPCEQPQFGILYEEDAYMVFRAQTFEPEFLVSNTFLSLFKYKKRILR